MNRQRFLGVLTALALLLDLMGFLPIRIASAESVAEGFTPGGIYIAPLFSSTPFDNPPPEIPPKVSDLLQERCGYNLSSTIFIETPCQQETPPVFPTDIPIGQVDGPTGAGDPCHDPNIMANCGEGLPTDGFPRNGDYSLNTAGMTFETAISGYNAINGWLAANCYYYPLHVKCGQGWADQATLSGFLDYLAQLQAQQDAENQHEATPEPESPAEPQTEPQPVASPTTITPECRAAMEAAATAREAFTAAKIAEADWEEEVMFRESELNAARSRLERLKTQQGSTDDLKEFIRLAGQIASLEALIPGLEAGVNAAHQELAIAQAARITAEENYNNANQNMIEKCGF